MINGDLLGNLTLQEAKELIQELLNETEEMKNENKEISEKALNMLTEKELEILELNEKIHFLSEQVGLNHVNNNKDKFDFGREDSLNSVEVNKLMQENEELKMKIQACEETISKLKEECDNKDFYSQNLIRTYHNDEINNNEIFHQIELLNQTIRQLEDRNAKLDANHKEYQNELKKELFELENKYSSHKNAVNDLKNEITAVKSAHLNELTELQEQFKKKLKLKDDEIAKLMKDIENYHKEKMLILNEFENFKKDYEGNIDKLNTSRTELMNLKTTFSQERRTYEDKIVMNEKKYETEKNKLIEQLSHTRMSISMSNTNLLTPVKRLSAIRHSFSTNKFNNFNLDLKSLKDTEEEDEENDIYVYYSPETARDNRDLVKNILSPSPVPSLSLEENLNLCDEIQNTPQSLILEMENQIEYQNSQIAELNLKVQQLLKKEKELKNKHDNEVVEINSEKSLLKLQIAELTFEKESATVKFKNENKIIKTQLNQLTEMRKKESILLTSQNNNQKVNKKVSFFG
jgi:hypothetical protein